MKRKHRNALVILGITFSFFALIVGYYAYLCSRPWFDLTPGRDGVGWRTPPSPEEDLAAARDGQPIVEAIYQYREDVGVWPRGLGDLVPTYLPEEPQGWRHVWAQHGYWSLTCFAGYPHSAVRFSVGPDTPGGWKVTGGDWDADLAGAPGEPRPDPADPQERHRRFVREMRRRIAGEPDDIDHRRKLIDVLVERGELAAARQECRECRDQFPRHWWPVLMRAILDHREQRDQPERLLKEWAEQRGDFWHRYLLAQFYLLTGQDERGHAELQVAARSGMLPRTAEISRPDAAAWRAAALLLAKEDYHSVLALCGHWEDYWRRERGDISFFAFRAAVYLKLGEFDKAREQIETADRKRLGREWAELVNLRRAVRERDRDFTYDPGRSAGEFTVEVSYR
jgi:hypothetical protein